MDKWITLRFAFWQNVNLLTIYIKETSDAIVDATNYPLSIICVGVGDGPWELMEEFDDKLPKRRYDNFQFVPFNETMARAENREVTFSIEALQEIPEQYQTIKKLGLLGGK